MGRVILRNITFISIQSSQHAVLGRRRPAQGVVAMPSVLLLVAQLVELLDRCPGLVQRDIRRWSWLALRDGGGAGLWSARGHVQPV